MTTILAFRDGMYADSCCTDNGVRYSTQKIFAVHQMIVGCSGLNSNINEYLKRLPEAGTPEHVPPPDKLLGMDDDDPEFAGLVLSEYGLYAIGSDFGCDKIDGLYHAIGSGRKAALGALHALRARMEGVNPVLCIQCAIKADAYSDAPVQWMKLGDYVLHKEGA